MPSVITMRDFGRYGRWGNQLLQYAFLRVYAKLHGLELQLPPWVGNYLLGANEPPVSAKLETMYEPLSGGPVSEPIAPVNAEYVNRDFGGYAQWPTSWLAPHKEFVRSLFQPTPTIASRFADAVAAFDTAGKTRIGIHLRRGDYGRSIFYITPVEWYLDWLKRHWDTFNEPVLFVATEDRYLINAFDAAGYRPILVEDLGVDLKAERMAHYNYLRCDLRNKDPRRLDWFPEWYLLTKCEILVTPNSTYSLTAGMASDRLRTFYRSQLPTQSIEAENLWNCTPCQRWQRRDWEHVPGAWLATNPDWRD